MNNKSVAIILNSPNEIEEVKERDIILVDGGARFFEKLNNKKIVCVVGDFDSLDNTTKEKLGKIENIKLEKEKNFSDGEFALRYAVENGYSRITIYGGTGGRIDHVLCNISLLKIAKDLGANATIVDKNVDILLANNQVEIDMEKGATLSILPFFEECKVKSSKNLYYPLKDLVLTKSDTRGLSNIATDSKVSLNIETGYAVIIINKL